MPVLDPRVEAHTVAAIAQRRVERGDDRVTLFAGDVAGREVDHDGCAVVGDGDEIAPVRDLVGTELHAHRRSFDRRPTGVVAGRVEAEDRHVADIAPGRKPGRDDLGPTDFGAGRDLREARHARRFERRPPAERVQRNIGTTIGYEHHVSHGRGS